MTWLIVAILGYLFFALASLGDKVILKKTPKPKLYAFYVSFLSIFVLLALPFVKFTFPNQSTLIWAFLDAIVYVWGLYILFLALEKYDVSRVIPTLGATQPIFIFLIALIIWPSTLALFNNYIFIAFILLLLGGVLISSEKNYVLTKDSLGLSFFAALLFSLDFIFQKFVFLETDLISGFILMRFLGAIVSLIFLFDKGVRRDIRKKEGKGKTGIIFILAQISGGLATVFQSWAIVLVPVAYLAIVNALKGVQYVFLFILTIILSFYVPKYLKESLSKRILLQKLTAVIVIAIGLFILIKYGNFIY
ncbi:MAG: hypothetical protein PHT67_02210 [Candidatus Pacebacteria bacterium]|nr:hypothetical protein [Candidatus Paceibacterota bacterium]MDD5013050.1 hypothetical protein [Candidatus Paceibacterota bacterium]